MIKSKAWNWKNNIHEYWQQVADEFLPVALQWKAAGLHKVLDLGCGIGRNALYLAEAGFSVHAFDLSKSGLARLTQEAKARNLDIKITFGDMIYMPFEDGLFDCLLAFHSIYHTDYQGLEKVVSEINRVLTQGGEIFLTLNSKENDAWNSHTYEHIDQFTLLKDETTEKDVPHTYLSYQEVLDLLTDFKILKIQQIFDYWENKKHAHFFIRCRK